MNATIEKRKWQREIECCQDSEKQKEKENEKWKENRRDNREDKVETITKIKWIDLTNPPLTFDPVKAKRKKPSGSENEKERIFFLSCKNSSLYWPTKRKLKLDLKSP